MKRVYVFLNLGGGHEKMNAKLREVFGETHLVLIFPNGYQPKPIETRGADEVFGMRRRGLLPAQLQALADLRKERVDCIILQFDSVKLRLFAAAMRPGQCLWWRDDGHVVSLPTSFSGTLWQLLTQRLRGMLSLARIYRAIQFGRFKVPSSQK